VRADRLEHGLCFRCTVARAVEGLAVAEAQAAQRRQLAETEAAEAPPELRPPMRDRVAVFLWH
jgi:hypothetical protein